MAEKHIHDVFEEKARKGDGAYAIAYALLDLSASQEATARALNRLGLADASTPFGAIELLAMEVGNAAKAINEGLESIAGAVTVADDE